MKMQKLIELFEPNKQICGLATKQSEKRKL